MPRARKGDLPELEDLTPAVEETPLEAQLSALDEVVAGLTSAEECRVKVYRRGPDQHQEWCGTLSAVGFSEEVVAERWGGGRYVCQFIMNSTGRVYRAPTIRIVGPPKSGEKEPPAPTNGGAAGPLAVEVARLQGLVEGLTKGGQASRPALDPIEALEKLTTIMRNVAPPAPPVVDPMQQITTIVQAVEKVVNVGREIAPERAAEGTDWSHVVDKTVDAVSQLVQESRAQRTAPVPVPTAALEGGGNPGALAAPAVSLPEGTPGWAVEVAEWVPRLLGRAVADKDPGIAADIFVEDVSDSTRAALRGVVAQPGFIEATLAQLAGLAPETAAHQAWFTEFLAAVRDGLIEPAEVAESNGGPEAGS